jgi:hypothetical protein
VTWVLLALGLGLMATGLWLLWRSRPRSTPRHDRANRFERFHARRDAEQLLQITDEQTLRPLLDPAWQRWLSWHLFLAGLLPVPQSRRQDDT